MLAQGLPVECSEHQTLLPSDAKCSSSTPFKNTSHSSHVLCILPQGNWGTGMQDRPEHLSKPGSPLLRAHQRRQNPPGAVRGGPLSPAGAKEKLANKWRQKRAPGWRGLADAAGQVTMPRRERWIPSSRQSVVFFKFSYLFGSRTIQVQMRPGSEPVDCSSFQLSRNHSKLINKSLHIRRERFMH